MKSLCDKLVKNRDVYIAPDHKGIPSGKPFFVCSICTNISVCEYFKLYSYKLPELNSVNRILTKDLSIPFRPYSDCDELLRNAIIERIFLGERTIACLEEKCVSIAQHLSKFNENTSSAKFHSVITGLQKLSEFKKTDISVLNCRTNKFIYGKEMRNNFFVSRNGVITNVEWFYDRKLGRYTQSDFANGIIFTTNDFDIFNEPDIVSKLKNLVDVPAHDYSLNMINGIAGCGKTTRLCKDFIYSTENMILSSTRDAATDVRRRLRSRFISEGYEERDVDFFLNRYVRTIDSVLVNISVDSVKVTNLMIDEALMRHPGEVFAVILLLKCSNVHIIGDVAQIPYVNRVANYTTQFHQFPFPITERMYLSYRCPVDVVATIADRYDAPVTSASKVEKSMVLKKINNLSGITTPNFKGGDHVIVFKQSEKQELLKYWRNIEGSSNRINTVHEFQGRQAENIFIVRISDKPQEEIYLRKNYALVAITRHTNSCYYFTPILTDAVSKFIIGVPKNIRPYIARNKGGGQSSYIVSRLISNNCPLGNDHNYHTLNNINNDRKDPFMSMTDKQRVQWAVEYGGGYRYNDISITDNNQTLNNMLTNNSTIKTSSVQLSDNGSDVSVLQSHFDRMLPKNAERDNVLDQLLTEKCDLNVTVDNIRWSGVRKDVALFKYENSTLKPVLRTSCPVKRVSTATEILLGIQKRNASVPETQGISIHKDLVDSMVCNFVKVFLDPSQLHLVDIFKSNEIGPTPNNIQSWLDASKYTSLYLRNNSYLEVTSLPFDKYDYSIKESPKPIQTFASSVTYQALQTISAHKKFVNSVFCPVIKKAKDRLMCLMKSKYIMFFDMSSDTFIDKLNRLCNPSCIRHKMISGMIYSKELDISKYDKSQGYEALAFQCTILKMLGCSNEIIGYYQICQKLSRMSSREHNIHFYLNYQMKSGVALTLLGNTLFTMATNAMVYPDEEVIFAAFCGDDAYYLLEKGRNNICDKSTLISNMLNLEVKEMSYHFGYFCSKFLLMGSTGWYLIPDPLKLLNKLGRKDILDYEHAEEYRVSSNDNFNIPTEESIVLLNLAMSERYNVSTDNFHLITSLKSFLMSPEKFRTLYQEGYNYIKPHSGYVRYDLSKM